MSLYRFVGAGAVVGDTQFTAIGQQAEFSDEMYREVLKARAAFIPEADYLALEFLPADLERVALDGQVTPDFEEKLGRAHRSFRETLALEQKGLLTL